jgi:hypothetical protein
MSPREMRVIMKAIGRTLLLVLICPLLISPMTADATEARSVFKIGSDVVIEVGQKVRNVVAIGGQITINGKVDNHVVAIGGSAVLTKTAFVGGNVVSLGGVIVMARDAQVNGSLTEINSSNFYDALTASLSTEWEGWSWIFAIISLSFFLVILVLALLIVALLPKPITVVAEAITHHTYKVVLWGLFGLIMIAPLALLLTVSVVGIALIPLEVIVVACAILLGFVAVGQLVGRKTYRLLKRPNSGMVRETFWGLILLWLIGWLPYIGWMVKAVAIVIGLGAVLVTRFGTHESWKRLPPAPTAAGNSSGQGSTPPISGQDSSQQVL